MNGTNSSTKNNLIIKTIALLSLVIIAFYLVTEHRAHLIAYSSYIFFAFFILMHIFMHSGHGGHGSHGGQGRGGGCCGGHNHGERKHGETETEIERNPEAHERIDHYEHSQEKSK